MSDAAPSVTDRILCTACGEEARASEGYPCATCGGFVCVRCSLRGVVNCRRCEPVPAAPAPPPPGPRIRGI